MKMQPNKTNAVVKIRCTVTNLNAKKINNLMGIVWKHIPDQYSRYHAEIDPKSIKIIHGELKDELSSHTNYLKADGIHLYGEHNTTFRPQTFGFSVAKEIENYTLDFDIYVSSEEIKFADLYIKMNEMIKENPNTPADHHIIL